MCHPLQSVVLVPTANQSPAWSRPRFSNTLNGTHFTKTRRNAPPSTPGRRIVRQAGWLGETEKRATPPSWPGDIRRALAAAEDRKAADIVLLDLRKAAGFTDFFLICSGGKTRHIRAIAHVIIAR